MLDVVLEHRSEGARLLDLGCGTGTYSVPLAREGFDVVGLDFSQAMLRRAAAKGREGKVPGTHLRFDQADFNAPLRYEDDRFDQVLSVCSLHCVADPVALFGEVRRVLRPGGWFVLVALGGSPGEGPGQALNTTLPRRAFWSIKRRMARGSRWPRYSRAELIDLLGRSGFDTDGRLERAEVLAVRAEDRTG